MFNIGNHVTYVYRSRKFNMKIKAFQQKFTISAPYIYVDILYVRK